MEQEVSSGARSVERQNDSLAAALGNPEHTGRIRGVEAYRGWKEVFRVKGEKSRRKPRARVDKDEIVAQVCEEVSKEYDAKMAEYDAKMAEMESRLLNRFSSLALQSEQPPPISPGVRRSSQASGTWALDDLENLKVLTTVL